MEKDQETHKINLFQLEEFANMKFRRKKKGGLAGKKVPVRELLQWQKGVISQGLLKDSGKEAVTLFKLIQTFMGDRTGKEEEMEIAFTIVSKGILCFEIRDEIYCQLVKQVTFNPSPRSTYRGWDLITLCVQYFPTSHELKNFMVAFFSENMKIQDDERIPLYAKFCIRLLPKTVEEGARGRVPDIKELVGVIEAPFKKQVFGTTLDEIMEIQLEMDKKAELPLVLTVLAQAVIDLEGHKTEGIFRVPGDSALVTTLKIQIENGNYSIAEINDPHIPGSLLKLWMRELLQPIIPTDYYDSAIAAAKSEDAEKSVAVVEKLPKLNRKVVNFVIEYLRQVALPENVPKTKMSVPNLAMVFAPNFLRCPSEDPSVIFNTQKHQQTFVRHLIEKLECKN